MCSPQTACQLNKLQGSVAGMVDTIHTTIVGETHNKQKATIENKTHDILFSVARKYVGDSQT